MSRSFRFLTLVLAWVVGSAAISPVLAELKFKAVEITGGGHFILVSGDFGPDDDLAPFLQLVIIQIAVSHLSKPSGESSKIVPTLTENCFLHSLFLHCQTLRDSINVLLSLWQRGQIALPSAQRREATNLTQNKSSETNSSAVQDSFCR